jgi:hypothetical protein
MADAHEAAGALGVEAQRLEGGDLASNAQSTCHHRGDRQEEAERESKSAKPHHCLETDPKAT